MKYDDYSLRQIRVAEEFYVKLKRYCHSHCTKMFSLYDEVLNWFLEQYANNPLIYYHASFKNGRCLSLWVHKSKIEKIQQMAKTAQVSDARIIATALMLYFKERNISL